MFLYEKLLEMLIKIEDLEKISELIRERYKMKDTKVEFNTYEPLEKSYASPLENRVSIGLQNCKKKIDIYFVLAHELGHLFLFKDLSRGKKFLRRVYIFFGGFWKKMSSLLFLALIIFGMINLLTETTLILKEGIKSWIIFFTIIFSLPNLLEEIEVNNFAKKEIALLQKEGCIPKEDFSECYWKSIKSYLIGFGSLILLVTLF